MPPVLQCWHDHEEEVCGDCIDLDVARCKEEAHQERALTAVQFEQDEVAMEFRALALQEQARRIQSGEIVCVANHDVETKSCLQGRKQAFSRLRAFPGLNAEARSAEAFVAKRLAHGRTRRLHAQLRMAAPPCAAR
jgi:hypothetical protein